MRVLALALAIIVLGASQTEAQWGMFRRGPVGPFAAREWREAGPRDPGRIYLYEHGVLIGGYCPALHQYRIMTAFGWEAPSTPPADLPERYRPVSTRSAAQGCGCKASLCPCQPGQCECLRLGRCDAPCNCADVSTRCDDPVTQNFGIDLSGLNGPTRECYRINGHECSRDEVIQALEAGKQLTDDSRKRRVTLIGPEAACKAALEAMPTDLRTKYLVQSYRPDNFAVARCGFKTDGNPTIYFQDPPDLKTGFGVVLWREDDYRGPDTWDAIRKADPEYKPNLDPGPGRHPVLPMPTPVPGPGPGPLPPAPQPAPSSPMAILIALIAAVGVLLLRNRMPQPQS